MEEDFLIIGLTGPVGSGCSTLAEALARKLEAAITEYLRKRPAVQASIAEAYRSAEELRSSIAPGIRGSDTGNAEEELAAQHRRLKELLEEREVMRTLELVQRDPHRKYCNFTRISMSDIIVKYAFERFCTLSEQQRDRLRIPGFVRRRLEELSRDTVNGESVIGILEKLRTIVDTKEYASLKKEFCSMADQALKKVGDAKTRIVQDPEYDQAMLQDWGENIRARGDPFDEGREQWDPACLVRLAEEAKNILKYHRNRRDEKRANHFVIDAIRNHNEVEYFRRRYARFFLVSLFAPEELRKKRLGSRWNRVRDLRDRGEDVEVTEPYRLNVTRCVYLSDIAINNENDSPERDADGLLEKLMRYLALMKEPGCTKPTKEETFMHEAYSLSLRSNCMARQVGALITDAEDYVVGAGWNDVGRGQVPCGLRLMSDFFDSMAAESRLKIWLQHLERVRGAGAATELDEPFCFKDAWSKVQEMDRVSKIRGRCQGLPDLLRRPIKRLEYCRALHAEENAILQTARQGGIGVRGGTIYTTSLPCPLCAKKIYQAGIRRVVYTEPYPEELSTLFLEDGMGVVKLEQFEGVKSYSYFRLFKPRFDKKELIQVYKMSRTVAAE